MAMALTGDLRVARGASRPMAISGALVALLIALGIAVASASSLTTSSADVASFGGPCAITPPTAPPDNSPYVIPCQ